MQEILIVGAILVIICTGIVIAVTFLIGILMALIIGSGAFAVGAGMYLYCTAKETWLAVAVMCIGGIILGACIGAVLGALAPAVGPLLFSALGALIGLIGPLICVCVIELIKSCLCYGHPNRYNAGDDIIPFNFHHPSEDSLDSNNWISLTDSHSLPDSDFISKSKPGVHFFPQPEKWPSRKLDEYDYTENENITLTL